MSTAIAAVGFLAGAAASLATSWVLVTRIERIGARLGLSDAMLGLVAALAADTPEISSAVSALLQHQPSVGVGVVLGSNVFNLAALLGLGAVLAGGIALHRRVVALEGAIAIWVAMVALLTVLRVTTAAVGLPLVSVVLVPYVLLAGMRRPSRMGRLGTGPLRRWLGDTLAEGDQAGSALPS
jgi:cation:H+ antiporter